MENLRSTDEIKEAFESINLPEIDVSDSVINSIKNIKRHNPEKKKVFAISLAAAALFLLASAFATVNIWILKDKNNNIILRYQEFNEENQKPFDIDSDLELLNLINNLEPGKAIVYYDARQPRPSYSNDAEVIVTYSKPVKYTDIDMLIAEAGIDFATPSSFPAGYAFAEGDITFDPLPLDPEMFSKLKEEAMSNGKNIASIECETSSKARSVSLVYKNMNKEFRLHLTVFQGENLYADELKHSTFEKMTLNNTEILYVEKEDDIKEIIMRELYPNWESKVETSSYIHYTISSKDLSKEELLNIVRSMIP